MTEIILIGGGGHCKACIEIIEPMEQYSVVGILDASPGPKDILGYPVLGGDELIPELVKQGKSFLITVGQIKSSSIREKIYQALLSHGAKLETIYSAHSIVSRHSKVGEGSIVMHGAMVNAASRVGKNCIINNKALVEHDCVVGDHVHISTGAILNGGCYIGNSSFIGSSSVVSSGVHITDHVILGAGSVVIKNIEAPGTYAGNPAKRIDIK